MSDTDSFIDEVTEEVRRDKMFGYMKKYGWIAVVAVVGIVGAASYGEYQKSRDTAAARASGDALLNALAEDDPANRVTALQDATLEAPQAHVIRQYLLSAQQAAEGDAEAAAAALDAFLANSGDSAQIYRDIAELKALTLGAETMDVDLRRSRLEAMAQPGQPLALLASEQLALIEIEAGETEAALTRLQAIILDAEVTAGLRQRASQLMVALGGEPETAPQLSVTQ
ncbi:hypothetical protein N6L24_09645 [Cognatishimia sp. SS12]|uniref:hypothetical protein n=1 Tax=Cognatishimia sp. SS12 TaxID=2979465 RepID=UPI00232E0BE4|nr:hypothetical protein [Cognatishimia sp. SS12]MDC0738543.1 hypothetical protein [Cognatishimia sp. SS12]